MDKVQIYASDALKGTVWGNIADALSMATGGLLQVDLHPSDTLKVMKNKFNGIIPWKNCIIICILYLMVIQHVY